MESLTSLYEWLERQSLVICRKVPVTEGDADFEFTPLGKHQTDIVDEAWDRHCAIELSSSVQHFLDSFVSFP